MTGVKLLFVLIVLGIFVSGALLSLIHYGIKLEQPKDYEDET